MPAYCIKNEETNELQGFGVPVYDILTDYMTYVNRHSDCFEVKETYIEKAMDDFDDDIFVMVCSKEECAKINKLTKPFCDLSLFEEQSRDKVLKLLDKGYYAKFIEYMKLKNALVYDISYKDVDLLIADVASVKAKLKELISLF